MPRWSNQFRTAVLDPNLSTYREGYHKGHISGLPGVDTDLIAANIKWNVTVFGILGTMVQWIYDLYGETGKPPPLIIPTPSLAMAAVEDHSGGGHTATPNLIIPEPSIGVATAAYSSEAVGAGIWHDDSPPTDTDYTTQVNNATANDFPLLPSPGAVGDGFYFGLSDPFDSLCLNIGTPGAGTWTITWKYYNGITWTALPLKYDETNHFRAAAGYRWVALNGRPGDWAQTTLLTYTLYFIKAEITAYTSMTTQPLGTQAWLIRYT